MPKALQVILISLAKYVLPFVVAYFLVRLINRYLDNKRLKGKLYLVVLKSLITVVIWFAAAFTALSGIPAFDKTWETVIASSTVAAAILGLASQTTLSNVIAGIAISASKSRPFDIGERVKIGNYPDGNVVDMTLRHIEIVTYKNEHIFITDAEVNSAVIINYSRAENIGINLDVSIAYESDADRAMKIISDIIRSHPLYPLKTDPVVMISGFGASGVNITAVCTCALYADTFTMRTDCYKEILRRFRSENIEIPYDKLEIVQNHVIKEKKTEQN